MWQWRGGGWLLGRLLETCYSISQNVLWYQTFWLPQIIDCRTCLCPFAIKKGYRMVVETFGIIKCLARTTVWSVNVSRLPLQEEVHVRKFTDIFLTEMDDVVRAVYTVLAYFLPQCCLLATSSTGGYTVWSTHSRRDTVFLQADIMADLSDKAVGMSYIFCCRMDSYRLDLFILCCRSDCVCGCVL